jgi:Protein of unknown function (DUF2690)
MKRTLTRSRSILVRLVNCVVLLALVTLMSVTASAATCFGSGCNALSPLTTGCNSDAYSVNTKYILDWNTMNLGSVSLMYSAECQAVWSEVVATIETVDNVYAEINPDPAFGPYYGNYSNTTYTTWWVVSPMANAPELTCHFSAYGSVTGSYVSIFNCPGYGQDCTPTYTTSWTSATPCN